MKAVYQFFNETRGFLVMSDIKLDDIENMSDEDIDNLTADDHWELGRQRKEKGHIKNKANQKSTAQDLRTQVLVHGVSMIERVQNNLLGNGDQFTTKEAQSYEMLWPILEGIISKTEDLKVIEAKNASEVVAAVTKGKLTMKEGLGMMALLKDQVTIEELPKLIAQLEEHES